MVPWWIAAALVVAGGCHVRIDGAGASDAAPTIADGDPQPPDAALHDAALDAPSCDNGRVIYLNFDGVTLTRGASDATTNHASWMTIATGTAPAYHTSSATRTADIQTVVDAVRAALASFPITVVTQRPAAGPYVMVVFGGTSMQIGSMFNEAVNQLDCGDLVKSDVAWLGDSVPLDKTASFALGAVGYGLGLTATTDPADCMCGWGNTCQQNASMCTLSASIAAATDCNVNPQDELATFDTAFCK